MVEVRRTVAELRAALTPRRRAGDRIGLVPTMGALHAGHRSLVERSVADADVTVVSVFVNPLQFAPGEDYGRYPRDLDADVALLAGAGADLVLAPAAEELTPPGRTTTVAVAGLTERLEGATRPGHFDGVATIVTTLFGAVRPDVAFFGEKDYQQLAVVRRLTRDLHLGVEVVGCPIVREPDGLALSSRNAYLSPVGRSDALVLSSALLAVGAAWDGDSDHARTSLRATIGAASGVRLDYAEVVDPETLEPVEGVTAGPAQALVAAWVGTPDHETRLIDTIRLERPGARHGPSRS